MNVKLKNATYKQMLWIGMASITLFFAGLTSAVIVRSSESGWQEISMPKSFWLSTLAIILGSMLLIISKRIVKKGKNPSDLIFLTFVCGVIFAVCQFRGWSELVNQGKFFVGEGSSPASSFLYVITFAHLVHVIGGLISVFITFTKSVNLKYTKENYLGIELTSIYWHFLDILWIYLFAFLLYII